jgi:hypothetical protein
VRHLNNGWANLYGALERCGGRTADLGAVGVAQVVRVPA